MARLDLIFWKNARFAGTGGVGSRSGGVGSGSPALDPESRVAIHPARLLDEARALGKESESLRGVLVRGFGVDRFAGVETDGQVGLRDVDDLRGASDQVHLDAAQLGAIARAVEELVEV